MFLQYWHEWDGGGETKRETGMCKMRVTNTEAYEDGFFMASGKFGSKKTRVAGIALSIVLKSGKKKREKNILSSRARDEVLHRAETLK